MAYYGWSSGTELYHYGIPGQKWGQRRYQNPDGSLTEEGRARYGRIANRHYAAGRALSGYAKRHSGTRLGNLAAKAAKRQVAIGNSYRSSKSQNKRDRRIQTALKVGAAAAGAAALGYGAYKLGKAAQLNKGVRLGMTKATKNRIREENAAKLQQLREKKRSTAKAAKELNEAWKMTPAMKNAIKAEKKEIRSQNRATRKSNRQALASRLKKDTRYAIGGAIGKTQKAASSIKKGARKAAGAAISKASKAKNTAKRVADIGLYGLSRSLKRKK